MPLSAFQEARLILAEKRVTGEPFDMAWRAVIRTVSRGNTSYGDNLLALAETKEAWRRAYLRQPPTPHDVAAGKMLVLFEERQAAA